MTAPHDAADAPDPARHRADTSVTQAGSRPEPSTAIEASGAICPYLTSAGGSWRTVTPSRDHRCVAVTPAAPQATEKQRRHCLSPDHTECALYRAARSSRQASLAAGADPERIAAADALRRPLPRTAPVLLEQPRLVDQVTRLPFVRAPGQLALVGLMVLAFAVVALTRLSGGSGPSPAPSAGPSTAALAPSGTPASDSTPTPTVIASPSAKPTPTPVPSFRTKYTVKKGDTLNTVASRFKTTAAAIRTLNGLKSNVIHIGQVLKIP